MDELEGFEDFLPPTVTEMLEGYDFSPNESGVVEDDDDFEDDEYESYDDWDDE